MRKQLNKLLVKFGLLITKAPTLLTDKSTAMSDAFPADLTDKVTIGEATDTPNSELFELFAADTNVHKWHHYFEIYEKHFGSYRNRPIRMLEIGVFRGGARTKMSSSESAARPTRIFLQKSPKSSVRSTLFSMTEATRLTTRTSASAHFFALH